MDCKMKNMYIYSYFVKYNDELGEEWKINQCWPVDLIYYTNQTLGNWMIKSSWTQSETKALVNWNI